MSFFIRRGWDRLRQPGNFPAPLMPILLGSQHGTRATFSDTMTTNTRELLAANEALRAEYPTACIVDAAMDCKGFKLTVIPASINEDSQIGKGWTVEDAMADLRAKFIANDPVAKIRKQAEELGYGLLKLPQD
jgi:hypothetical protein